MKKKVVLLVTSLLLCVAMLAGCGSTDNATTASSDAETTAEGATTAATDVSFDTPVSFTFATSGTPGSMSALMYEEWIDRIQEESNGMITVDYQAAGALGNESEIFAQIMDGVIEAGVSGIATYTNYNTIGEVFQLPFLITTYEEEWAALNTPEWDAIIDATEESIGSIYICGALDVGLRHIATTKKPVQSLEDLKGLKIRTASSEVLTQAITDLGANPIVVGYTEVYSALSNGIVDGEDVNYMTAVAQNHYEVVKYFTEVGMYPYPSFVSFNKDFVDSLPEGYWDFMQKVMNECTQKYFEETIVGYEEDYKKTLEDNGVTIYTLNDLDAWREAIQPLYDEYTGDGADERVKAFIEVVEAMK